MGTDPAADRWCSWLFTRSVAPWIPRLFCCSCGWSST